MSSMRVKLSYTVDEEDVLDESAKLLNLAAEDVQQVINLFTTTQRDLRGLDSEGDELDGPPNLALALEKIEELRTALMKIDVRCSEVVEIVRGYRDYQQSLEAPSPAVGDGLPEAPLAEAPADLFGSD